MVFPVDMYGCESWTVKKAEHWKIDAFELWCWRRPLRVLWTARRANQSILKKIGPGCSLEAMILMLKLQYFCHLMRRTDSLEKTVMLGKIEGGKGEGDDRGWDGWMASQLARVCVCMCVCVQLLSIVWFFVASWSIQQVPSASSYVFCIGRQILYYCYLRSSLARLVNVKESNYLKEGRF